MIESEKHNETNSKIEDTQSWNPPLSLKILVGYLYFLQGLILSLPFTMTLVYANLPEPGILSIFAACKLPFSFKFLTAPFIQKYTNISYGKRKTWIIISQLMAFLLIFLGSFFTGEDHQVILALILLVTVFCITLQDISLDALAIKQLRVPYIVAMLQGIMQTAGFIIGGLVLFKLASRSKDDGEQSISTPSFIFRVISFLILIPNLIIHFQYNERTLDSEKRIKQESITTIISYYQSFCQLNTRWCRVFILFLFYFQGFNYFEAYYEYELILEHGFSRNILNTTNNIVLIPISIFAIFATPFINKIGLIKSMLISFLVRYFLWVFVYILFPTTTVPVIGIVFIQQLTQTFIFIQISILINEFPVMGLSGMFITMLNSGSNFGRNTAAHVYLTGKWGWNVSALIGLTLQGIVLVMFTKIFQIVYRGTVSIQNLVSQQQLTELQVLHQKVNHLSDK